MTLAVPALVQAEIFAAAALQTITAPTLTGRAWFAAMQVATGFLAASASGWPRTVAITAAVLMLVEYTAARMIRSVR